MAGILLPNAAIIATVIMGVYLAGSSIATTVLIPAEAFPESGQANGGALAYPAHGRFVNTFGTVHGISSVPILWSAGAYAAGVLAALASSRRHFRRPAA